MFVYILQCSDDTLYTGWTTDLNRRAAEHKAGRGARYTRSRRPVKLVYHETQPDRRRAMQREAAIKKLPRAKKLALISSFSANTLGNNISANSPPFAKRPPTADR
ncbi:MAG TPA: GIY-YIG nuclease family protein [Chloroflexi bacterium]|nr:GIY-YIG nuclease family protein [Chloroflexota bacterium]